MIVLIRSIQEIFSSEIRVMSWINPTQDAEKLEACFNIHNLIIICQSNYFKKLDYQANCNRINEKVYKVSRKEYEN